MSPPRTAKVPFGGDYNPDQWPAEVWDSDYRLCDEARIDTVTLGGFTWALTQPALDVYDFSTLDRIVERACAAPRRAGGGRRPGGRRGPAGRDPDRGRAADPAGPVRRARAA